jgi:L-Ala-D/L-Glu epimerase
VAIKIASAKLFRVRLPLLREVANAKHTLSHRDGVLVQLTSDTGVHGWGEASPFPGFGLEAVDHAYRALEGALKQLTGSHYSGAAEFENPVDSLNPTARGALECAVLDLLSRTAAVTMRDWMASHDASNALRVECNALMTARDLDAFSDEAEAAVAGGFTTVKLKVGALSLDEDASRVAHLRKCVGAGVSIRLDANEAYGLDSGLAALDRFAIHDIEYLEQPLPVAELDAMARLRAKSPIRIAADEAATSEQSVRRAIDAGAADVIIVKPSAAGGPLAALQIARTARRAGLGVTVTSMLDGAIATASALQVASVLAGEGGLPACGLATQGLFKRDVAVLPSVVSGGVLLSTKPGLGIDVSRAAVNDVSTGLT